MAYARSFVIRKGASVEVDEVDYASQLWKLRLVPDTPTQTRRTFGGVDKDRDTPSWTVEVDGHSDRGAGGFAAAVDTAVEAGDTMEFVVQLKPGVGQDMATFTVVPVPLEFGGEEGDWKQFSTTFEVVDAPVFDQSVS